MIALLIGLAMGQSLDTFTHQARLLQPDGSPFQGDHDITIAAYDDASDATAVWSQTLTDVPIDGGYVSVEVGPLDMHAYSDGLWIGLAIDSNPEIRTAVNAVPYAMQVDPSWPGIRLDPERQTAHNSVGGATVSDPTAHGGEARQTQPGDSGRIWGLHGHEFSATSRFTNVPTRVIVRAKIDDNTGTDPLGNILCSSNDGVAWNQSGDTGQIIPTDFDAPDTWQDFALDCGFHWNDANQFVGWDNFADNGQVSIDYVTLVPGAAHNRDRYLDPTVFETQGNYAETWTATDQLISPRMFTFRKRFADSTMRFSWSDNWRCSGDQADCRVQVRFRRVGTSTWHTCSAPRDAHIDIYNDTADEEFVNVHMPGTVTFTCDALSGATFSQGFWEFGPYNVDNPNSGTGQIYLGWDNSPVVIEATEVLAE